MKVLLLAIAVAAVACNKGADDSSVKALNPGQQFGDVVKNTKKKVAVIYYANETAPDADEQKNYDRTVAQLQELQGVPNLSATDKITVLKAINGLTTDARIFTSAVDAEVAALKSSICGKNLKQATGLIVFTNRTVRDDTIDYCEPGESATQFSDISVHEITSRVQDLRIKSSPLANPRVFKQALDIVQQRFPAQDYEYVLITKSHGITSHALVTRLSYVAAGNTSGDLFKRLTGRDLPTSSYQNRSAQPPSSATSEISEDVDFESADISDYSITQIQQMHRRGLLNHARYAVASKDNASKDNASKDNASKDNASKDNASKDNASKDNASKDNASKDNASKDNMEKERLAGGTPGDDADELWITKKQYFDTIIAAGKGSNAMHFNVVYVESCASYLTPELESHVRSLSAPNIGLIYTSDQDGIGFRNIDYAKFQGGSDYWRDWFIKALQRKAEEDKSPSA